MAARREQTKNKLDQVEKVIGQLRREHGRLTLRATAERAGVSATFLYENHDARTLVQQAAANSKRQRDQAATEARKRIEASWRERALNAEAELTRTQKEVFSHPPDRRRRVKHPLSAYKHMHMHMHAGGALSPYRSLQMS
ncbi:DUF6262 family protein [Streptomyces sp. NPDC056656]|uniref:DUF6262 family protein n=1 Tax=Streptomyces sp. NPDC056656 TaxID=3345895 RepID=UPI00367F87BE